VFPVDRPPIVDGVVTIDGERVVAVGTHADGGDVRDLGCVALLPGLVNAHTHLEFSHLRRPLGMPGMRLAEWIRLVIAERGRGNYSPIESIRIGMLESNQRGVTSIADITSSVPGFLLLNNLTVFREVIGFSRARAASALSDLIERLDYADRALRCCEDSQRDSASIGISPHAPYTVSPNLLKHLVELAQARGLPMAMHLAESREELELLESGTGPFQELLEERSMWDARVIPHGSRPMAYLRMLAEAPRALVVHGNYLDEEERSFLAAHADHMSLVFCPRTHEYFGHEPYPLVELLKAGVRVALGTDSRASNPDLDLLADMRFVARKFPQIDPIDVLRMGTLSGAEALGRSAEMGSITSGKIANLIAVPLSDAATMRPDELLAGILSGGEAPRAVWLRGDAP
jgi:cytosine/adenosine deaminase-related metal-dependent hydrolase